LDRHTQKNASDIIALTVIAETVNRSDSAAYIDSAMMRLCVVAA